MFKRFGFLAVSMIILAALLMTGCKEPAARAKKPKVTLEVSFVNPITEVQRGKSQLYIVSISSSDGNDGGIKWELDNYSGNKSTITKNENSDENATLFVHEDETDDTLTIKAVSTRDAKSFDTVTVKLTDSPPPIVTNVQITRPIQADLKVYKGLTLKFEAYVIAESGADETLIWSVSENTSQKTKIDTNGLLTVDALEEASFVTVTVTAKTNSEAASSAEVEILSLPAIRVIEIEPGTTSVVRGEEFEFKFTPTDYDPGAAITEVDWTLEGNNCDPGCGKTTTITAGILKVCANEKASTITVTVRSKTHPAAFDTATVNIINPFIILARANHSVFVAPGAYLTFGSTLNFADYITPRPEQVIWEVTGSVSGASMFNQENARLNVSAAETAQTLTVTARSVNYANIVSEPIMVTVLHDVSLASAAYVDSTFTWGLPGETMQKDTDGTFTGSVTVTADKEAIFAFNINGSTVRNDVSWLGASAEEERIVLANLGDENELAHFNGDSVRSWRLEAPGIYEITISPHTMRMDVQNALVPRLATPSKPGFSNTGAATWTPLADETNVSGYTVRLYKQSDPDNHYDFVHITDGTTTYNFMPKMIDPDGYFVTVRADGDNVLSSNSRESEHSDTQTVRARTPVTVLNWSGTTAEWGAVNGADTTGTGYRVTLYRGLSQVASHTTTNTQYSFASDIGTVNGSYTFTVTALGDNTTLIRDAVQSGHSDADFKLFNVWFFDTTNNALTPMTSNSGAFSFEHEFTGTGEFKFALHQTNHDYFGPVSTGIYPAGTYDIIHSTNENSPMWRVNSGYYVLKLEKTAVISDRWKLLIEKPVVVTTVDFESHSAVTRGLPHTFTPKLTGTNVNDAIIRWTVTGTSAVTSSFGSGAARNELTVGASEANTQLTITLYAKESSDGVEKSAVKTVTVRNPPQEGNVNINLTIQRHDGDFVLAGLPGSAPSISKSGDGQLTLTVTPQTGQSGFNWKVDDKVPVTGTSITLRAVDYSIGTHTVLLYATIDGIVWSLDPIKFTVIQ